MSLLRIGLERVGLRQPFKQALHTAAQLGGEVGQIEGRNEVFAVELSHSGLPELRKMRDDLNVRVSAVRFHTRRGGRASGDLARRVAAIKRVVRQVY